MSSKGILRGGFCAFSLSLSLLAGCASPVVPTPTEAGTPAAQAPVEVTPSGQQPVPAAPAPAAVTPVTLSGKASFRGEALSGYDVTVLDAKTGKAVERKADLAGVTTLAVLDKNLKTDASGAFSFQVVGLQPGQALRVQIRQGNGLLETIVTSDLQALGAKKMQLLQATAGDGLSVNELTTAIAKIARGVLTTTQVLSAEAAAPVLAQLATEMAALSVKLDTAFKANPNLANNLVSTQGKESEAVNALVSSAGALKDVTQAVARLVSQVAKSSAAAPAAANADVQAALAKVEFIGTVLTGAFSATGFNLTNSATGQSVDAASGDVGSVSSSVSGSTGSSSSGSGLTAEQSSILNSLTAADFSDVSVDDQKAVLTILNNHKTDLGLSTADWTLMLKFNAYDVANTGAFDLNSGRQQSVAKYLLERIFQRKTGGTTAYTSLSAIQADFTYAVHKESHKWNMISKIKAAKANNSTAEVVTALDAHLPAIKADFEDYLTWHADWAPTSGPWSSAFFADNVANITAYQALGDSLKNTVATQVMTSSNGVSDMAILTGLNLGLLGDINTVAAAAKTTTDQNAVLTLLASHKDLLALPTDKWDAFLKLTAYDRSATPGMSPTSGRQRAVAIYLIERIHERTATGNFKYGNVAALRTDFITAVDKETAKWNLIIDIAAAKANNNDTAAAVTALNAYLGSLRTDFTSYLTWHADWTVPSESWAGNWSGQTTYFAVNNTNITTYLNGDDTAKTAIATKVLQASNGVSDMAILDGLRPGYGFPPVKYRLGR
jgi:hypothetical protein